MVLISLVISWLFAITLTPLFCTLFLRSDKDKTDSDPYAGVLFQTYKTFLTGCIWFKQRRDRKCTITTQCDISSGNASVLFNRLKPKIESMDLPEGYTMEWGGEHENSINAQKGLFQLIPACFIAMVITTILTLFVVPVLYVLFFKIKKEIS